MVEGVVILPALIILFASILLTMRLYSTKLERNTVARRCAWLYSVQNYCDGDLPAECGTETPQTVPLIPSEQEAEDRLNQATNTGNSGVSTFLSGLLEDLLGETKRVTVSRDIQRPGVYAAAGATQSVSSSFSMVCNARPRSVYDLARDVGGQLKAWARGNH